MPTILVYMVEGRSAEQKKRFVKAVTEIAVETLGATSRDVLIYINEVPKSETAKGGQLISELSRP